MQLSDYKIYIPGPCLPPENNTLKKITGKILLKTIFTPV